MTADIWTPSGFVSHDLRQAIKTVQEYQSNPTLGLGRDTNTGNYVILRPRSDGFMHPVLDLGTTDVPSPELIKERLYRSDTRRRGAEIVRDVERANERAKQRLRDATHEGAGEVAEAVDVMFHKMGLHPTPRIFVPGKDF